MRWPNCHPMIERRSDLIDKIGNMESEMNIIIETPKRPARHDDLVVQAAAKEILPKVMEWLNDDEYELSAIEGDLVKALKHNSDGYDIAKSLEVRSGYSPDAALVEILDGCAFAKIKAHDKLCRDWVSANSIKEPPLQTRVTWSRKADAGVGVVVKNYPEGKSTVSFAALGHVPSGQIGCQGYVVEWEQLTVVD